jgi:ABC-type bacteriocin/lantibiotic exporter with double-glycine peptidase domain
VKREKDGRIAKMVLSKTVVGGAGGNWRTINEILDPNVVRQSCPMNCGADCGEMLLRARGVLVTQDVIADIAGAPSSASSLAQALNELDSGGTWFGSGVTEESFLALNQTGSWAAMFFETSGRFGHWVNVNGVDYAERVIIHDPADGTQYLMELEEFMSHWTLFSVFRR